MKTRFSSFDIICSLADLKRYEGFRVQQAYDIDLKTYLIKIQKNDEKAVILLESGCRIHTTDYEWPKNAAPIGFTMKLRKHLKNKRLEHIKQLGVDRVVDMQFGSGEAACHLFVHLYDKGNIVLTDYELTILILLRHNLAKDVSRSVKGKYPIENVRQEFVSPSEEVLKTIFENSKPGDSLKKILNSHFDFGPDVIEHVLLGHGLQGNLKFGKDFNVENALDNLVQALIEAEKLITEVSSKPTKGYIIQKVEKRPSFDGNTEQYLLNEEFHPYLFRQHCNKPYLEYESFDKAVDSFFSTLESQNIDMKAINQEKAAMKKLENVRRDHDQRLKQLEETQEIDRIKAELITKNQVLVDRAIQAIRRALANQMSWPDIEILVKEAAANGDSVAKQIKGLKLDINHITLELSDPYSDDSDNGENEYLPEKNKSTTIDIDLDLTAFANARKYYDKKRTLAKKQQKTIESQGKALKSAERKTKQALKEMKTIVNINKARKVFWFEKFFWFISSENYLIIAGRDMMQNELIVKRYMKSEDIYVHADIHGASSVVIKNPSNQPIPPKTLNEAGIMALAYSNAWKAKILTPVWWVRSDQVSKTAPSGEYVSTGAFIIRGKKNYLPPGNLIMGYSFLFKLEENSIFRHIDERKVKELDSSLKIEDNAFENKDDEEELVLSDDGDEDDDKEARPEPVPGKEGKELEMIVENIDEEEKNTDSRTTHLKTMKNEEEETDNFPSFPDIEYKIHHSGKEVILEANPTNFKIQTKNEEESVVYLGDDKPVMVKMNEKGNLNKPKKSKQNSTSQREKEATPLKDGNNKNENQMTRSQRAKLKRIKDKYKDQDEEDRRLCLEILQNTSSRKNRKEKKKENSNAKPVKEDFRNVKDENRYQKSLPKSNEDKDTEYQTEVAVNVDLDVLSSLTGIPENEDEILFAVPVVAPYISLQNYKFKVKITPGTGKRGKAAKAARELFLRDKSCTQRERDVMKGVKDEDLCRNFPGLVKISGPNLRKK